METEIAPALRINFVLESRETAPFPAQWRTPRSDAAWTPPGAGEGAAVDPAAEAKRQVRAALQCTAPMVPLSDCSRHHPMTHAAREAALRQQPWPGSRARTHLWALVRPATAQMEPAGRLALRGPLLRLGRPAALGGAGAGVAVLGGPQDWAGSGSCAAREYGRAWPGVRWGSAQEGRCPGCTARPAGAALGCSALSDRQCPDQHSSTALLVVTKTLTSANANNPNPRRRCWRCSPTGACASSALRALTRPPAWRRPPTCGWTPTPSAAQKKWCPCWPGWW